MPAYEYRERLRIKRRDRRYSYAEEKRKKDEKPRINCWGYTGDSCYYAPKSAFCATKNPVQEFKHMVDSFHQAVLECLMEFYFEEDMPPCRNAGDHKILEKGIPYRRFPSYGQRNLSGAFYERSLSVRNKAVFP